MLFQIVLGIFLGMTLVRFALWRRMHGHWRFARHHHRGWRGFHALRLLRLDARQRAHVKDLFLEAQRLGTELSFARIEAREELLAAALAEPFDRARLDALGDRQLESMARAKAAVLDQLAALHASLTPEQRARLREFLGAPSPAPATEPQPYR